MCTMIDNKRRTTKVMKNLISVMMLCVTGVAMGQFEDIRPEDRAELEKQAMRLFETVEPSLARAAASTVEVKVWRKRMGFGTVVAPQKVLTKWSDVRKAEKSLSCRSAGGRLLAAKVIGVYKDEDLVLLEVPGLKAPPIVFAEVEELQLGSFLVLARPDGQAGGIGVVSVLPRSLRQEDRAFLGVQMDFNYVGRGVKVQRVESGTGAEEAGLLRGDVVLGLNDAETNGRFELTSALQRMDPGEAIQLRYLRGEDEKVVNVVLGGRESLQIPPDRMAAMNRMGGHRYSRVVTDFARVIQTDMQIYPEDCGAPVVDLDGRPIGIALARAGRIKSFVLPAESIKEILAEDGEEADGEGLSLRWEDDGSDKAAVSVKEVDPKDVEEHLKDMERIMKELDRVSK